MCVQAGFRGDSNRSAKHFIDARLGSLEDLYIPIA